MSKRALAAHRMLNCKPVISPGDGTSLWTITRAEDFAPPFTRLLGNPNALGRAFHLTGDAAFTWDQIYLAEARALGTEAKIVHVPSDTLIAYQPERRGPLLGDKSWSVTFDNSAIKAVVGDFQCETDLDVMLRRPIATFRASNYAPSVADLELDALMDRMIAEQTAVGRDG